MLIFCKFNEGKLHVLSSNYKEIYFFANEDSRNFRLHVEDVI